MTEKNMWYAILLDNDDRDWGTGSYNLDEAISRAQSLREDYPETYIAVIDNNGLDPVCIDEIRDF